MGRIIAIANQKGGVAKTVTSFNLAAGLARAKIKVCVVDMDPQSHMAVYSGINLQNIKTNIFDLFVASPVQLTKELVQGALLPAHGFDLLPGSIKLANAEKYIQYNKERRLEKIISLLPDYDVTIIDCPPSLGFHLVNALTTTTDVIIPIQPEPLALDGIGQLWETIQVVRAELNPALKVLGILPTRVIDNTSLHSQLMKEIYGMFGADMFECYIRQNTAVAESTAAHQPIFDYAPRSSGAEDYSGFVKEVLRRMNLG